MLLHRHHIATLLQALLVLFAFSSCTDDELVDGNADRGNATNQTECYLYLQIQSDSNGSQTRANNTYDADGSDEAENGDFVCGDEFEKAIDLGSSFFIFFKEDGTLFSTTPSITIQKLEPLDKNLWQSKGNDEEYLESGYLTKIYPDESVTDKDDMWPRQCLLVLNAPGVYDNLFKEIQTDPQLDLDAITASICNGSDDPLNLGRSGGYLTMTNAVIGETVATQIDPQKNIVSIKDLSDWGKDDNNDGNTNKEDILRVRVERMSAKFSFDAAAKEFNPTIAIDEDTPGADPLLFFNGISEDGTVQYVAARDWRIKVTGWGINALEKDSYLFKQIDSDWGGASYYRSYWSKDPHYDNVTTDKYPWQFRSAVEKTEIDYYGQNMSPLKNYSYDDFVNQTYTPDPEEPDNNEKREDNFDRLVYVPENTYGENVIREDLDSRTNFLAGTHLIVCGQLEIQDPETKEWQADGHDWFRDRSGVYYKSEKECFVSFVHSINHSLSSLETMNYIYYDWDWDKNTKCNRHSADVSGRELAAKSANQKDETGNDILYKLYYKDEELDIDEIEAMSDEDFKKKFGSMKEATILHGDGKRLPWFEDENGNMLLTIRDANGKLLKIHERDIVEEKTGTGEFGFDIKQGDFVRAATSCDIKSLLYEWLGAVDHFCDGKMYYAAPVLHNGANDPDNANMERLGDYGVVRNNWYRFTLKDIKNIGIPVDKPDQPIVPDPVKVNDVINVTITVIPWHKIDITAPVL